jgi:hypothetical protein
MALILSLIPLIIGAGCDTTSVQTLKTRGVYTTLQTPKLAPNASLDLPPSGLTHRTRFKQGETPVAIVTGYGGTQVTLELIDLATHRPLFSHEVYSGHEMVALQTLDITTSGDYEIRVLLDGVQDDSCRFSVQRDERPQADLNVVAAQPAETPKPEEQISAKAQPKSAPSIPVPVESPPPTLSQSSPASQAKAELAEGTRTAANFKAPLTENSGSDNAKGKITNIETNPETAEQYFQHGLALYKQGEFAKAVSDFREAARRDPNFVAARNQLAWVFATCPDDTIRNAKEAIQISLGICEQDGWKNGRWIDTFATAHAEMGNFKHAVEYEKQALAGEGLTSAERAQMRRRLALFEHQKAYRDKVE